MSRTGSHPAVAPQGKSPRFRRVDISDTPLSMNERMKTMWRDLRRRFGKESWPVGRRAVIEARERGRLVSSQLEVRAVDTDSLRVRARPKASMAVRIFRKETDQWSELIPVEDIDITVKEKE